MVEFTPSPEAEAATPSDHSSGVPPQNQDGDQVQSEEEGSSPKQSRQVNGGASDEEMVDEDEDAGGLFGSEDEDEDIFEADKSSSTSKRRRLDDEELDSGDDEGRQDRMEEDQEQQEQKEILTATISLGRHAIPKGSDGELYLLKFPQGVGIEEKAFTPRSFQPPTTGHHGAPPTSNFSPAQIANTTIRWRRNPDNPSELQSNARILRWTDGSLTLQIGSNAMEQLELPAKSLAPPQIDPKKPTPTSIKRPKTSAAAYDSRLDSHTYLASIHQEVAFAKVTNHITTSLTVQTTIEENDDALLRLQESMAAAMKGSGKADDGDGPGVKMIHVTEDPELAKRKAEIAEREKLRAEKRRQNQEQRTRDRQERVFGKTGRTGYGAGLSVGGLEDDGTTLRGRPKPARKPRRRNSEYSDDEDDYRKGRTREDEYDEDDGFLVGSDEEPEVVADDSDEEEILGDDADAEGEEDAEAKPSTKSPKRTRDGNDEAAGGTRRRRKVVDEDDDED